MAEPTNHELSERIAVLEEKMNTKQQEYKTDIARLAEDMAKRDKENQRWQIGMWVAAIVILGVIIRFSSVPAVTN